MSASDSLARTVTGPDGCPLRRARIAALEPSRTETSAYSTTSSGAAAGGGALSPTTWTAAAR